MILVIARSGTEDSGKVLVSKKGWAGPGILM